MNHSSAIEDSELLRRYADERSEEAFAELVRRHLNLVYACAVRRVGGDVHLAEDVAQQVFSALARQAGTLERNAVLGGWLYTSTRFAAAQAVRTERRRRAREEAAFIMDALTNESSPPLDWERLRPVLDETIDELDERDRTAVVLRFFEGRSFADVGARLRLSENAARMRVDRALDKLHALLGRRGIQSTSAALGLALTGHAAIIAPAGLATSITSTALATGAAAAGAAGAGVIATFMSITKLQIGAAAAIAVAGTTGFLVQAESTTALQRELAQLQQEQPELAPLQKEHARLAQLAAEVAALRRDDAEFARLRNEAAALQAGLDARTRAAIASKRVAENRLPADGSGKVYDINALDRMPRPTFQTRPQYPSELRSQGVAGEAVVDFVVNADGVVQRAYAVKAEKEKSQIPAADDFIVEAAEDAASALTANSAQPAFDSAAVEAVRKWRFDPGQKGGQRVTTHMQVPIVFTIGKGQKASPWF